MEGLILLSIFVIIAVVGIFFTIRAENKRQAKWAYEKSIGMWDYVDQEYIEFLNSHQIKPKKLTKETIKLKVSNDTWWWTADIFYNKAGIYLELTKSTMANSPPSRVFIRGKDKPSKFSPRGEWFSKTIEKDKKGFIKIYLVWYPEETSESNYLVIKNNSNELFNELKECLI